MKLFKIKINGYTLSLKEILFIIFLILLIVFLILLFVLGIYSLISLNQNEKYIDEENRKYVGEKILILNDSVLVLDYYDYSNTFLLSNGIEISSNAIKKIKKVK